MVRTFIGIGGRIGGSIIASLATERMLIWALRRLAKRTDTMLDDHAVDVIDAALQGDSDGIRESAKELADAALDAWDAR